MFIEDPSSGKRASVDSRNRLTVFTTDLSQAAQVAIDDELTFSFPINAVDPDAGPIHILYMANTDSRYDMVVTRIILSSTVAGLMAIHSVSGTPSNTTAVAQVNRTVGSSITVTGNFYTTTTNLGGLTSLGVHHYLALAVSTDRELELLTKPFILKNNTRALTLNWAAATGVISGSIEYFLRPVA